MTAARAPRVVILDRDGTIVVDRHYLADPAGLEFLPGAAQGLRHFRDLGCRLVVVTNQSGVGRGFFSLEQAQRVNDGLRDLLAGIGVRLEAVYLCPHVPEAGCTCRKPGTGLLQRAVEDLDFEATSAVVVGDKASDVGFGQQGGATTILIRAPHDQSKLDARPDYIASDLVEAARIVETLQA